MPHSFTHTLYPHLLSSPFPSVSTCSLSEMFPFLPSSVPLRAFALPGMAVFAACGYAGWRLLSSMKVSRRPVSNQPDRPLMAGTDPNLPPQTRLKSCLRNRLEKVENVELAARPCRRVSLPRAPKPCLKKVVPVEKPGLVARPAKGCGLGASRQRRVRFALEKNTRHEWDVLPKVKFAAEYHVLVFYDWCDPAGYDRLDAWKTPWPRGDGCRSNLEDVDDDGDIVMSD